MQTDGNFGALQVRVMTARGALPVSGATVLISRTDGNDMGDLGGVISTRLTDASGLTQVIMLPTVSAAGAKIGEAVPSVRYNVEILAEGFEPALFIALPIYSGITSLQNAELVPGLGGGIVNE